jgi:hypothetical protein
MRRHSSLRPTLFAERVAAAVRSTVAEGGVLDIGREAVAISGESGVSPPIVARELLHAGVAARVPLEISGLAPPRRTIR